MFAACLGRNVHEFMNSEITEHSRGIQPAINYRSLPSLLWLALLATGSFRVSLSGQITPTSRYYYAIENLDTASVVRRGLTSSNGIPSNGLILSLNTQFCKWLSRVVGGPDRLTPH